MENKEIMQMALDCLLEFKNECDEYRWSKKDNDCIEALRTALAQPEPEPFEYWNAVEGWVKIDEVHQHFNSVGCGTIYKTAAEDRVPLYTEPPKKEWVGLTDEERKDIFKVCVITDRGYLAAMVEAKLKDKNI